MSELASYQSFSIEVSDYIAHVQFSRPEALNSMNKAFWLELPKCMRASTFLQVWTWVCSVIPSPFP